MILIVKELASVGGFMIVKEFTLSVAESKKFCALERSTVTTFAAIESVSTASLTTLVLNVPSTSRFVLGTVVPIPTLGPTVVIAVPPVPTIKVAVVTIPALIVPVPPVKL